MVKRSKFITPKLWVRRNGRLCRCDSVGDPSECWKELRTPRSAVHVLDLPEECLVIVFKSLTAYEICNVARVCKRFYHVSFNPTLWNSIDLSFEGFSSLCRASLVDTECSWTEVMTNTKRRMLFASFLSARNAALTEIRSYSNINIHCEARMFIYLLNNCNVKNLKKIYLRLPGSWGWERIHGFQRVLRCLVQNCCNVLKSLRCDVDSSYTTAKLLGSLRGLEYLNLHFPLLRHSNVLQPEAMHAILSSLPNLKYLKITVRQDIDYHADYFPGYVFKSDSLETLDFGFTKRFWITKMLLPKLHTIRAESLYNDSYTPMAACFFDVVEKGCPAIQTINGFTSLVPGLQNFHLSDIQKRDLYFCDCPVHSWYTNRGYF